MTTKSKKKTTTKKATKKAPAKKAPVEKAPVKDSEVKADVVVKTTPESKKVKPPIAVVKDKGVKPPTQHTVRLVVRHSLTLVYDHDVVCASVGRCLCKLVNGVRSPMTLHLHPGIVYDVPEVLLERNPLRDLRRKGKVFLKK